MTHYELNCSQYVLMDGSEPLYGPYDEISICFDKDCGTLFKHGKPELVKEWHSNTIKKYADAGFNEMTDCIIVITGRFPLEELNRCLDMTGYVLKMYRKLLGGELGEQPIDYGRPLGAKNNL